MPNTSEAKLRAALVLGVFALLLAAPAAVALADVYLVELPGVAGHYDDGQYAWRTTSFQLPGTPTVVRSVSIRVVGSSTVSELYCGMTQEPIHPWPGQFDAALHDPPTLGWWARPELPLVSGPFDATDTFVTSTLPGFSPGTWGFLADGQADLAFGVGPMNIALADCGPYGPPPTVTIDHAWLLVDADFAVPVHGASWGQVKAIYR